MIFYYSVITVYLLIGAAHLAIYVAGFCFPGWLERKFGVDMGDARECIAVLRGADGAMNRLIMVVLSMLLAGFLLFLWPLYRIVNSRGA